MRLILLGPPGCGKGTQSKLLCRRLDLDHVGTGDLLRAAVRTNSPVGQRAKTFIESGQLVPDDLVNDLMREHFRQSGRSDRFVMDGYPRTLAQARVFDEILAEQRLELTGVLLLVVSDEAIIQRLSGRWSCPAPGCKATYHTESNPPQVVGMCNDCATTLVQREDDHQETVQARLVVYHRDTAELIPFYRARGLLHEVDGHGGIDEVYNRLLKILKP